MSPGLCILAGGLLAARLEVTDFTLEWRHSIEKILWREAWRVEDTGLRLIRAEVRGSGAGMDPPAGAQRTAEGWSYIPELPPQRRLNLARSGLVEDYRLCLQGECRPLGVVAGAETAGGLKADQGVVLTPCDPDLSPRPPR